ncbi:unnamed protein product [Amoebophrya sp. A120]|nr:unnamed protein product [Amoebophrya sp. A120]|eukprot:GSA120T00002614001.1
MRRPLVPPRTMAAPGSGVDSREAATLHEHWEPDLPHPNGAVPARVRVGSVREPRQHGRPGPAPRGLLARLLPPEQGGSDGGPVKPPPRELQGREGGSHREVLHQPLAQALPVAPGHRGLLPIQRGLGAEGRLRARERELLRAVVREGTRGAGRADRQPRRTGAGKAGGPAGNARVSAAVPHQHGSAAGGPNQAEARRRSGGPGRTEEGAAGEEGPGFRRKRFQKTRDPGSPPPVEGAAPCARARRTASSVDRSERSRWYVQRVAVRHLHRRRQDAAATLDERRPLSGAPRPDHTVSVRQPCQRVDQLRKATAQAVVPEGERDAAQAEAADDEDVPKRLHRRPECLARVQAPRAVGNHEGRRTREVDDRSGHRRGFAKHVLPPQRAKTNEVVVGWKKGMRKRLRHELSRAVFHICSQPQVKRNEKLFPPIHIHYSLTHSYSIFVFSYRGVLSYSRYPYVMISFSLLSKTSTQTWSFYSTCLTITRRRPPMS